MKKILLRLLGWVILPFVLVLLFVHYLGLLFAVSLIAAIVAHWGFGMPLAAAYFSVGWKVYVGLGVFTFAFLMTFAFQHCCVGLQTFSDHLKHRGWKGAFEDALGALIWPWCWFRLNRNLRGWGMSFVDAVINAFAYWFVSSWRGTTFESMDFQTGEMKTGRVKTPEDAREAIRGTLAKSLPTKE